MQVPRYIQKGESQIVRAVSDGWKRKKSGGKLSIFRYPPSSLIVQYVTLELHWESASSRPAVVLPVLHCLAVLPEGRMKLVHKLPICKLVVLEFHDNEASPPFPLLLAANYSAIILAHLLHQTCACPARRLSPTLALHALHFYTISHFALSSPQDVRGSHLTNSCQVLIPASVPSVIQML